MIVPLLRVGMQPVTLCVTALDAQRPGAIDINPSDNLSIQRNAP